MPLQNRVHPTGTIVAVSARGMYTGNRGILHNEQKKLFRQYAVRAWITCSLEYKDNKRQVMNGRHWTELFFLDEATAFAAGHRPCAYCRNRDYKRFKQLWLAGNEHYYALPDQQIKSIDKLLHEERLLSWKDASRANMRLDSLPYGTMFRTEAGHEDVFLCGNGQVFEWSFNGYRNATGRFEKGAMIVPLTPPSIMRCFAHGYRPVVHPQRLEQNISK